MNRKRKRKKKKKDMSSYLKIDMGVFASLLKARLQQSCKF